MKKKNEHSSAHFVLMAEAEEIDGGWSRNTGALT